MVSAGGAGFGVIGISMVSRGVITGCMRLYSYFLQELTMISASRNIIWYFSIVKQR